MKRIFTFWEPREALPGYIRLCMQTWEKYLPDYEIVTLDYSNLHQYLSEKDIREILCKDMSLPMQSDCLRCALLYRHGGIWMDADTIITSSTILREAEQGQCCMIQDEDERTDCKIYGAFIYAREPQATFLSLWRKELPARVQHFRRLYPWKKFRFLFRKKWKEIMYWGYCVNSIIEPIARTMSPAQLCLLSKNTLCALPEYDSPLFSEQGMVERKLYEEFYFHPEKAEAILQQTRGIILLHNSWTPRHYREMSAEEFLKQDVLLADLLREVLQA